MKNRKKMFFGVIFLGIVVIVSFYLRSTPLIEDSTTFSIGFVRYNGEDITNQINKVDLNDILTRYSRNKFPNGQRTYSPEDMKIEIIGIIDGNFVQILLGNNWGHYNNGRNTYNICDANVLVDEIEKLFLN